MQRALIVDDSRTARVALRQMLARHHFDVEMKESAESALDYLKTHLPDVIFMDHLMPGMDGFDALRAIKGNPAYAAIPIVMYTSKEGDVYVGQARALGAVDILTKPARHEELEQVLGRVEQYRQHHDAGVPTLEVLAVDEEPQVEPVRPAVVRTIELPALREPVANEAGAAPVVEDQPPTAKPAVQRAWAGWMAAAVAVGVALFLVGQLRVLLEQRAHAWRGIEWAINQSAQYPFGQLPLGDERLALLEGMLGQLSKSGFRGTVRLEGYAGDYCLIHAEGGQSLVLPPAGVPHSGCDRVGLSEDDARWLSVAQSPRFKDFLRASPLLANGDISIEIVGHGRDQNLLGYPAVTPNLSAAEWNEVAQVNSRVEVRLLPSRTRFW